jgi:hypothetical protein
MRRSCYNLPSRKTNVTIVWGSYGDVTIDVTIEKNQCYHRLGALHEDVTIYVTIHVTIEKIQCYHRLQSYGDVTIHVTIHVTM